ncbi:MAG: response regulator [Elusimicrobiota bacterium]
MFSRLFKKKAKEILLIEDDEAVSSTVEIALKAKNYGVLKTTQGHNGIQLAMRNIPALIILDIRLPDMEGWQVISNLKSSEKTKNIPILILSQLNQVGDITTGFELGINGYVTKPLDLGKLYKKISEILGD